MGVVVTLNCSGRGPNTVSEAARSSGECRVVQFASPSGAKVADAVARCPSLVPLREYCISAPVATHARRERILASLLRMLVDLPSAGTSEAIASLCACPVWEIWRAAQVQLADGHTRGLHRRFLPGWDTLEGDEREFAQRCAVVLAEACRADHGTLLARNS